MKITPAIIARLQADTKRYLAETGTVPLAGGHVGVLSNAAASTKASVVQSLAISLTELDAALAALDNTSFTVPVEHRSRLQDARNSLGGAAAFIANSLRAA